MKIIMDDGHYYTEKQYRKDLMRMFNALRNDERFAGKENCDPFDCEECPLLNYCGCTDKVYKNYGEYHFHSFRKAEAVYNWAKTHPIIETSKSKLK